ncbi:MAG: leucine-rich repeat protein [Clostridiales bacterium]|nr:leucine-rich repeat protein [Clostridiales bacterium]
MKRRKILSVLLAMLLTVSVLSPAMGVSAVVSGDYEIEYLTADTVKIVKYNGSFTKEMYIEPELDGCAVVEIADDAYANVSGGTYISNTVTEKIYIPDSVKYIGSFAFYNFTNLQEVHFTGTLNGAGAQIFGASPWWHSFSGDFVTAANVLLEYTGTGGNVTLPSNAKHVAEYAFSSYDAFNNRFIPSTAVLSLIIPTGYKSIGENAFTGCGMSALSLPATLTTIGDRAFYYCTELTSVVIPNSVQSIGAQAFSGCESLENITVSQYASYIGTEAFGDTPWLNARSGYVIEGDGILIKAQENDTTATIPELVKYVNSDAFTAYGTDGKKLPETRIRRIKLSDSVTGIGRDAFSNFKSLESVTFSASMSSIPENAFRGCSSLMSISFPGTISEIGAYAFADCTALPEVVFKEGMRIIGDYAFQNCTSLERVEIPDNVISIGYEAFSIYDTDTHQFIRNAVIVCNRDSVAYDYATETGHPMTVADEIVKGDLDGNGLVEAKDARIALRAATGLESLTETQRRAGDINGSGEVDASDARTILRVATKLQTFDTNDFDPTGGSFKGFSGGGVFQSKEQLAAYFNSNLNKVKTVFPKFTENENSAIEYAIGSVSATFLGREADFSIDAAKKLIDGILEDRFLQPTTTEFTFGQDCRNDVLVDEKEYVSALTADDLYGARCVEANDTYVITIALANCTSQNYTKSAYPRAIKADEVSAEIIEKAAGFGASLKNTDFTVGYENALLTAVFDKQTGAVLSYDVTVDLNIFIKTASLLAGNSFLNIGIKNADIDVKSNYAYSNFTW